MNIKVICGDCDMEMGINHWDPDQSGTFAGFDCPRCGASFYGTIKEGEGGEDT